MEIPTRDRVDAKGRDGTATFFEDSRKRFWGSVPAHLPALVLNADGTIQHVTRSARHMLEYRPDERISPSFFGHVHGKNLYQVMRDVADMVCYGKTGASWLLRLKTGQGRWRWFKVSVMNRLETEDAIQVHLDGIP